MLVESSRSPGPYKHLTLYLTAGLVVGTYPVVIDETGRNWQLLADWRSGMMYRDNIFCYQLGRSMFKSFSF